MELTDDFRLALPIQESWAILTDLRRLATWIPGAAVARTDGTVHHGSITVKVGPVTASYAGSAELTKVDEAAHRVVVTATGSDPAEGEHAPSVVVLTVTLRELRDGTQVDLHARIDVRGRVQRFGEGVLADVSRRTLERFVADLRADLHLGPAPRAVLEPLAVKPAPEPSMRERFELLAGPPADPWTRTRRREADADLDDGPLGDPDGPPRPEDRVELPPPDDLAAGGDEPAADEPVADEPVEDVQFPELPSSDAPRSPRWLEQDPLPSRSALPWAGEPVRVTGRLRAEVVHRVAERDLVAPVLDEPAPDPVVEPEAAVEPDPVVEPEPPAPRPRPALVTRPAERTAADVLAGPDPAVTGRLAPVAVVLLVLWLLRRLFGGADG